MKGRINITALSVNMEFHKIIRYIQDQCELFEPMCGYKNEKRHRT